MNNIKALISELELKIETNKNKRCIIQIEQINPSQFCLSCYKELAYMDEGCSICGYDCTTNLCKHFDDVCGNCNRCVGCCVCGECECDYCITEKQIHELKNKLKDGIKNF